MSTELNEVGANAFKELAAWVIQVCRDQARQCLHSWVEGEANELTNDFVKMHQNSELVYISARKDRKLIGSIGCEYDVELGRGWMHGPHLMDPNLDRISDQLFAKICTTVPNSITTLDAFPNIRSSYLQDFYKSKGFIPKKNFSHTYLCQQMPEFTLNLNPYQALEPHQHAGFSGLFAELFPDAYYSPSRLLEMNGSSHRIIVHENNCSVRGFVVTKQPTDGGSGEIEFLGVAKPFRGLGHGRGLLMAGMQQLSAHSPTTISLNVSDTSKEARSLYESAGFVLSRSGIGLRGQRTSSSPATGPQNDPASLNRD